MGKHSDPKSPKVEPFNPLPPDPDSDKKAGGAHAEPKEGEK
jgi:hypothetical protein